MKISKNWLSEFVPISKSNINLENDLTKLGLEVDTIVKDKDDYVIDIEFTPNRGDCLSVYGTARDLSAYKGKKINMPSSSKIFSINKNIKIKDVDPMISPEYRYMILDNININTKTPDQMSESLNRLILQL